MADEALVVHYSLQSGLGNDPETQTPVLAPELDFWSHPEGHERLAEHMVSLLVCSRFPGL